MQKREDSFFVDFSDGVKVTIHGRDVDYKVDFIDGDIDSKFKSNFIDQLSEESKNNYTTHWRSSIFSILT